jgi:hypothetical protein
MDNFHRRCSFLGGLLDDLLDGLLGDDLLGDDLLGDLLGDDLLGCGLGHFLGDFLGDDFLGGGSCFTGYRTGKKD